MIMREMKVELEIDDKGRKSGSVSRRCPDISKLNSLTGFYPKISLKDGIQKTIKWYLQSQ